MINCVKAHNKAPSKESGAIYVFVLFFFTILPIITVKVLILLLLEVVSLCV